MEDNGSRSSIGSGSRSSGGSSDLMLNSRLVKDLSPNTTYRSVTCSPQAQKWLERQNQISDQGAILPIFKTDKRVEFKII